MPTDAHPIIRPKLPGYSGMITDIPVPAKLMVESIKAFNRNFEIGLDKEHQAIMCLIQSGQSVDMTVTNVCNRGAYAIVFEGFDRGGQPAAVFQHVSQVNIAMLSRQRDPHIQRQIGFITTDDE